MKRVLASLPALVLLVVAGVSAKGATTKIVISGGNLTAPIEIADSQIVKQFQVWAGAGTYSNRVENTKGFIIDWPSGALASRPAWLQRYTVMFYTTFADGLVDEAGRSRVDEPTYVVSYEFDPGTAKGFVYLPGKNDEWYPTNVAALFRMREGSWFHSSREWDNIAAPLIARR